jgi:hypothetical protein
MQVPRIAPDVSFVRPDLGPWRTVFEVLPQVDPIGSDVSAVNPDLPVVPAYFPDIASDLTVRGLGPGDSGVHEQKTAEDESWNDFFRFHGFFSFLTGANTRFSEKFRQSCRENFPERRNFFPAYVFVAVGASPNGQQAVKAGGCLTTGVREEDSF